MLKRIGLVLLGAVIAIGWCLYLFKPKCYVYYVRTPVTAENRLNFVQPPLSKLVINKQQEVINTWQY